MDEAIGLTATQLSRCYFYSARCILYTKQLYSILLNIIIDYIYYNCTFCKLLLLFTFYDGGNIQNLIVSLVQFDYTAVFVRDMLLAGT